MNSQPLRLAAARRWALLVRVALLHLLHYSKEAGRTSGVKHIDLQGVWCEASRLAGRMVYSFQDEWCEKHAGSQMCGVKLAGLVV